MNWKLFGTFNLLQLHWY